eukprot:TRINITY_DN5428_c0_g1_i3.p1 TRINITY_DN5428_c0_g1~~TRINITY_DN5428_c0_g1_i3.p1  ORF type:complete len:422 (+),score=77.44 TRINITY_DN5428_c0_g1_i3:192-1457(+)
MLIKCPGWSTALAGIMTLDFCLNAVILRFARYTAIDWPAYMDQVSLFMEGERHYSKLVGVTGPLVYPAGFVYMFSGLHALTDAGEDIMRAQLLFSAMYLGLLGLAAAIYARAAPSSFEPLWLVLLCLSKRVHSIFLLRLFNDGPAMMLMFGAVLCFAHRRYRWGCVVWSVALSVKMNMLLWLPGLGLVMWVESGVLQTLLNLLFACIVQVALSGPFVMVSLQEYLNGAFNFNRIFKHKWSVNFKWVPCEPLPLDKVDYLVDCDGCFTSKLFSSTLLLLTLGTLLSFCHFRWCAKQGGLVAVVKAGLTGSNQACGFTPHQICTILFTCNFIGVMFARSLHFQFYVWYFHSLPFLLWSTALPTPARLGLFFVIECCWNPWEGESSSVESSMLLTVCHGILLVGLWFGPTFRAQPANIDCKKHE